MVRRLLEAAAGGGKPLRPAVNARQPAFEGLLGVGKQMPAVGATGTAWGAPRLAPRANSVERSRAITSTPG